MLDRRELTLLVEARTATLATRGPDGSPRMVPICFVAIVDDTGGVSVYSPIDEKPKRSVDPMDLARVRDVLERPDVDLLVDRWSEDWSALGWVRCRGRASLHAVDGSALSGPGAGAMDAAPGERAVAIAALRAKYPQYVAHALKARPILRIVVERSTSWFASEVDAG